MGLYVAIFFVVGQLCGAALTRNAPTAGLLVIGVGWRSLLAHP
jgi:hypothetical protein